MSLGALDGLIAQRRGNFQQAIALYQDALRKEPDQAGYAIQIADCILLDSSIKAPADRIKPLVDRFPNDGVLNAMYGASLAVQNRPREAVQAFQRARSLGADPAKLFPPQFVQQIEEAGKPGLTDQYLTIMMWFGIFYGAVMIVMAAAGLVLAALTRGTGALDLLQKSSPNQLVTDGKIARVQGETVLARLYGFALMIGLLLFYAAIPFVIAGLLGGTALLLYFILTSLDRIPIKLILIIVLVGGFGAWSVFKSLFTRPAAGGFGLLKTSQECPRLYQLLTEVSQKVDTDPVNEVYLSPALRSGCIRKAVDRSECSASTSAS